MPDTQKSEQAAKLLQLIQKGREFGLVYKFDLMGIFGKNAKDLKLAGSNGKAKGFQMAQELVSRMPAVKDAVVVTRCAKCGFYKPEEGLCSKHNVPFPADGFCSKSEKTVIANQ